jgi:hypothetical protein
METVHQNSISNRNKRLPPSGRNTNSSETYPLRTLVHVSGAKAARTWRLQLISILCRVKLHLEYHTFPHGVVLNLTQE